MPRIVEAQHKSILEALLVLVKSSNNLSTREADENFLLCVPGCHPRFQVWNLYHPTQEQEQLAISVHANGFFCYDVHMLSNGKQA